MTDIWDEMRIADELRSWPSEGEPLGEDWMVNVWIVERDGRRVIGRLEIKPVMEGVVPPNGLTARDLKEVRLRPLLERREALDAFWLRQPHSPFYSQESARRLRDAAGRRGRRRPDDESARLALAYLDACREEPRRPIAALAKLLNRTTTELRDSVHALRGEDGWLLPGVRGVVGAKPGPMLLRWLEEHGETNGEVGR